MFGVIDFSNFKCLSDKYWHAFIIFVVVCYLVWHKVLVIVTRLSVVVIMNVVLAVIFVLFIDLVIYARITLKIRR